MKLRYLLILISSFLVFPHAVSGQVTGNRDNLKVRPSKDVRGLIKMSNTFVPKGQWVIGLNTSFSTHENKDYSILVAEGIDSEGHTVKTSPILGYALRNNMVIGTRFVYSRTFLRLDDGGISFGDGDAGINLNVDSYYALKHKYKAGVFLRQYIPFGESKRFALYTEAILMAGGSQAKFAANMPVKGTFETGELISLNLTPGVVAFVTNDMALELNVGVLGLSYEHVKQVHNQVTVGNRSSSIMSFKVNLLSIGLGMAFYL